MLLLVALSPLRALAQTDAERITKLESRIAGLEYRLSQRMGEGAALFLIGVFCALWAQNTRRNAWLWFFLGLLFSVITVLVLLYKNSQDRRGQT